MTHGGIRPFTHGGATMGFIFRSTFIFFGFSIALARPHPACAASFDCVEAKTHIEIAICGDAVLDELDSLLADEFKAAVAHRREQRQNLLSKQRAWLHARDQACSTVGDGASDVGARVVDCLRSLYAERIAVLTRTRPGSVGRFDGRWSVTYPCLLDKEACGGRSDVFSLDLWSNGSHLCGSHIATAHFGDQVDEDDSIRPSVVGMISGPTATVAFKSSWGGAGHAELTRMGKLLYWRVLDLDSAQSWIPGNALLSERPRPRDDGRRSCDATQPVSVGPG